VLARRSLSAGYFRFDDGVASFADRSSQRAKNRASGNPDLDELLRRPESCFDRLSLFNICELTDSAETSRTFEQVARTAPLGATVCFRNLMSQELLAPGSFFRVLAGQAYQVG